MMASKGAIVPVGKVMKDAGEKFDPSGYVPAVAGYYTAPNGQMLSFPFNSSTTIFYYNKDAFKAAGLDPEKAPSTWPEVVAAAAKLKASGHKCPFTTAWQGWTQLESFSAWHNVEFATKQNGLAGLDARMKVDSPLHVRHIENLANMAKQGLFVYKGRGNVPEASFVSGECAMITTLVGLLRQRRQERQVRLRPGAAALLPRRSRRAAEHGHRRREPVGDGRQEARGIQGRRQVLQLPVEPRSAVGEPQAHRLPADHDRRVPAHREVGLLQGEPRHRRRRDADDPQGHRQVARHPPRQLRADPRHRGRGARAGLGRQEDAPRKRSTRSSSAATSSWSDSRRRTRAEPPARSMAAEKRVVFRSAWLPWALLAPQALVIAVFFFWPAGAGAAAVDAAAGRLRHLGRVGRPRQLPQRSGTIRPTSPRSRRRRSSRCCRLLRHRACRWCSPSSPTASSSGATVLQDAPDLALRGGARGRRRAVAVHVLALASASSPTRCARSASTGTTCSTRPTR